jgi:hypothetical protein
LELLPLRSFRFLVARIRDVLIYGRVTAALEQDFGSLYLF